MRARLRRPSIAALRYRLRLVVPMEPESRSAVRKSFGSRVSACQPSSARSKSPREVSATCSVQRRHLAQANDDADASEVVAQPRRHAERVEEVGARRARDGEGRLEALGDAGRGEEAAGRVAVEDQLAGPRVVAEEGRRKRGVGGLGVAGEDLAREALAVDGARERPAHARRPRAAPARC